MNKYLSIIGVMLFTSLLTYSQAPGIFNYQGIARNSVGNVLENKTITLRLSIHDISSAGPVVYQESRTVTTNPFGLFNIQVGSTGATNVTGTIATLNWATGNKYLQVEIDPAGGSSFINLGVSQLASVPYALSSGDNYWRKKGNDISNINSGNVGIGTDAPLANLHIKSNLGTSLLLQGNESRIQFNKANGDLSGIIYNNGSDMFIQQYGGRMTFTTGLFDRLTISPDGNVGIGTPAPHPSSKLEIVSNNSGLLIPRMTEAQRNAISNPATSLMIYQTDNTPGFYFYNGSTWERLITPSSLPSNLWYANGNNIYNNNTGFVAIGTSTPGSNEALRLVGVSPYLSFYKGINYKGSLGTSASGDDIVLGASPGHLSFSTNGLTRMRIDNSGLVQVLHNDEAFRLSGNDSYMSFYDGSSYKGFVGATDNHIEIGTPNSNTTGSIVFYTRGVPRVLIQNGGNLKVMEAIEFKKPVGDQIGEWLLSYSKSTSGGDPPDDFYFSFNGGVKAWISDIDGDYTHTSDSRLKENFKNYKSVLDGMKKLDVLTYHYKADETGKRSFGLIAQNLQQYFPELVSGDEKNGYLGIAYGKTGVLAIKAIQEQQVIIERLEKKIEMLEKRLAALESKLR